MYTWSSPHDKYCVKIYSGTSDIAFGDGGLYHITIIIIHASNLVGQYFLLKNKYFLLKFAQRPSMGIQRSEGLGSRLAGEISSRARSAL